MFQFDGQNVALTYSVPLAHFWDNQGSRGIRFDAVAGCAFVLRLSGKAKRASLGNAVNRSLITR